MTDYDIEINDELTSKAEQRVLPPLFAGKPRQLAADVLHITLSTLDTHLTRVFEKHAVKSLPELMTKFYAEGLATAKKLGGVKNLALYGLVITTTLNLFAVPEAEAGLIPETHQEQPVRRPRSGGRRLRLPSRVLRRSSRREYASGEIPSS